MDKFKKIDREFLLTDSTVNCYGFRLLTSGYLLDEYKKNPIGYLMHNREKGVMVKWEDFRLDGDKVYAKPVINLSNELAEQTVNEIENGFLNAASVGHLVILEYTEDSDQKLAIQTGPTVTKWYNRECSLVDIPGNFNALALFDKDDNPINLADFTKPTLAMKQILVSAAMFAALNLKAENADETTVSSAFNDLVAKANKADTLQKDLNDLTDKINKDSVASQLSAALDGKKITKELSDKLAVDYGKNPEGLKTILAAIPAYTPVSDKLKTDVALSEDLKGKTFDELFESGKLAKLKAENPEMYKQIYKKEFGHDPKN